jgi:hypothetical protein
MKNALLIGNSDYYNSWNKLNLPSNDVNKVGELLENLKYNIRKKFNLNYKDMNLEIERFFDSVEDGDEIIFYFAGHGYNINSKNYILPIDSASIMDLQKNKDLENFIEFDESNVIDIEKIVKKLEKNKSGINILMLDACRQIIENVYFKYNNLDGFVETSSLKSDNIIISYATGKGNVALENFREKNSYYVQAIEKFIFKYKYNILDMFSMMTKFVDLITNGRQVPWVSSGLKKDFYFIKENEKFEFSERLYYEDLLGIYIKIKSHICSKYYKNDDELLNEIFKIMKEEVFIKEHELLNLIKRTIKGEKEDLGFIYILLTEKTLPTVDISEHFLFLRNEIFTQKIDNNNLYKLEKIKSFFESLDLKMSTRIVDTYNFNDKDISLLKSDVIPNLSVQIREKKDDSIDLLSFVSRTKNIETIEENTESYQLNKIILDEVLNYKNILIIGGYDSDKENFVTALLDKCGISDNILLIHDYNNISTKSVLVNKESTSTSYLYSIFENNKKEYNNYIENNINNGKAKKVILLKKDYDIDKNVDFFKNIISCNEKSYIIIFDFKHNNLENHINLFNEKPKQVIGCLNEEIFFEKCDTIVYIDNIYKYGSVIDQIYIKKDDKYELKYKLKSTLRS